MFGKSFANLASSSQTQKREVRFRKSAAKENLGLVGRENDCDKEIRGYRGAFHNRKGLMVNGIFSVMHRRRRNKGSVKWNQTK